MPTRKPVVLASLILAGAVLASALVFTGCEPPSGQDGGQSGQKQSKGN